MRYALKRIQSGEYAKMFITEGATGYPSMTAHRRQTAEHEIEKTGAKLRSMMPWITKSKIIDKKKELIFKLAHDNALIRQFLD